jgi:hypothetical protein
MTISIPPSAGGSFPSGRRDPREIKIPLRPTKRNPVANNKREATAEPKPEQPKTMPPTLDGSGAILDLYA